MRTLDRSSVEMVCPGSNAAVRLVLPGPSRAAVPRPTPSCAPEPAVYLGSSTSGSAGSAERALTTLCEAGRLRPVTGPVAKATRLQQFFTESLILAQDERWRR